MMVKSFSFKTEVKEPFPFKKATIWCSERAVILSYYEWKERSRRKLFQEVYYFKDNLDTYLVAKQFVEHIRQGDTLNLEILFIKNILDWMVYGD